MPTDSHIAVIGAGAAGLASAIFAAETRLDLKIVVLDSARTIGAKILVSGGGRCNVTHTVVRPQDFHAPPRVVERVLKRFNEHATVQWFESLGVTLKKEPTGKLFPVTNKARSVLNALVHRCNELGIDIKTNHRVQEITKHNQRFHIQTDTGVHTAHRVIMATGGKSLPKSGSNGSGLSLAQHFGHTVTECYPALVPLILDDNFFHKDLSGTSHEVTVTTTIEGKDVDHRTGSLLWTHFGVSGPIIMDASRFWVKAHEQGLDASLSIACLPAQTFAEVEDWLLPQTLPTRRKSVGSLLAQRLPQRVANALCFYLQTKTVSTHASQIGKIDYTTLPIDQLSRPDRRMLTHFLTRLRLPIIKARGWNYAEVTAGGVPLDEININSMASRKISGLYLVGEMLDCDGRIGGFNFQWAWSTGYIAGSKAGDGLIL